ncbi:uncharacterized protein Dana_GF16304 [Drosophila ananassae]|uniref:Odorant receptor n=1 Tax=Drosophila ananassae TaxID=7217 RepID=B3LX17_DROAN|nr:uncharacterized protein Dana_GF16304 [Drosophila ananassae]
MYFKYLRKPTATNVLTSSEAMHYFEVAMFWVGWAQPTKYQLLYRIASTFICLFSTVYLSVGMLISFIFDTDMKSTNLSELLTILQLLFNAMGLPIKVLFLRLHFSRFSDKVKDILGRLDESCSNAEEKREVHRWAVRCNAAYLIYQAIYSSYAISTFFASAFVGTLPWRVYNPFVDWRKSWLNVWKAGLIEFVIAIFGITQGLMSDVYALSYALILRAHLKLLRLRVDKLCSDPGKSEEENLGDLIKCIKDHKLINKYYVTIRPVISGTIFVQFLLIGLCLGLSLINILFSTDIWAALATINYINGLIVQTFPFCYVCDLIKSDCELLERAIFHSNWLEASPRYKKTLIFFLQRSQKPLAFTAGSIFPISTRTNIQDIKYSEGEPLEDE